MNRLTQRVVVGLTVVVVGLCFVQSIQSQALVSKTPGASVLERILVKVNGGLVTLTDLEAAQITAVRARGVPPQTDAELLEIIEEITPGLIVSAVEELLLVQRGRELGYALSDEQFQDILNGIKEENNLNDEQLLEALESDEGMTLPELREIMERQMLVGQVQQIEILGRVSITDTEAREYYDTHLDEFTNPATVTLREILIAVPVDGGAINVAREAQARAEADSVHARVLAGEDFEQVAAEESDAASRANGGLIGPIQVLDLAESVRERVAMLDVGMIGEIERTNAGFQILKLESGTQPAPKPFEEVNQGIMDDVFNDRRRDALNEYVDRLRDEAIIEWMDEGFKSLYEEALANLDRTGGGI